MRHGELVLGDALRSAVVEIVTIPQHCRIGRYLHRLYLHRSPSLVGLRLLLLLSVYPACNFKDRTRLGKL